MKNVQFLHPPLPHRPPIFYQSEWVRIGQEHPYLRPWTSKFRLSTTSPPYPHPLWYSCCISIIFSRLFHHIPSPCNSQLFTTKNQFKLNPIFYSKTKQTCLTRNAKNKTKMLSKPEPDTCLEHL